MSWVKRAVAVLRNDTEHAPNAAARWLVGSEAQEFLRSVLFEIDMIVPALNDDADFETLERYARDVQQAIKRRRLALLMGNTDGRTTEEAATFRAKATELGGS